MRKIYFIAIALISLFTSCSEEINLTVAGGASKIVIEGNIENGQYPEVIVTRNSPLSSAVNFASILVTDAKVYVSDGLITDTLKLGFDTSASIPFNYRGSRIIGAPGQTYYLTVIADGRTFTATTTIPTPVKLDSVWWKADPPHDSLGLVYAHLTEPAGLGNAYKWYAKRPIQHIFYDGKPTIINRRFISPRGGNFNDKFIDGKSFPFAYDRGYDPTEVTYFKNEPKEERGYFKMTDTIYIKFCSIDNASDKFYSTFDQALSNNGNPFAAPVAILSNIKGDGGLGVWSGFGATFDTIFPPH